MKKTISLLLLFTLLFSACARKQGWPRPRESREPVAMPRKLVTTETLRYAYLDGRIWGAGSSGARSGGLLIKYYDIDSGKTSVACEKEGCSHTGSDCPRWAGGGARFYPSPDGESLWAVVSRVRGEPGEMTEDGALIFRIRDGEFSDSVEIENSVSCLLFDPDDGDSPYLALCDDRDDRVRYSEYKDLVRYSLSGKNFENIVTLPYDGMSNDFFYDNYYIRHESRMRLSDEGKYYSTDTVLSLDVLTGQEEVVYSVRRDEPWKPEAEKLIFRNGEVLSYRPNGDGKTARVVGISLVDGSQRKICPRVDCGENYPVESSVVTGNEVWGRNGWSMVLTVLDTETGEYIKIDNSKKGKSVLPVCFTGSGLVLAHPIENSVVDVDTFLLLDTEELKKGELNILGHPRF